MKRIDLNKKLSPYMNFYIDKYDSAKLYDGVNGTPPERIHGILKRDFENITRRIA